MRLSVANLDVAFGARRVVAGMTFEAEGGALVGLIGANGAGKSTALRAIAGLISPAAGTVSFDGQDVALMSPAVRAKTAAYLPQGQAFHWSISVYHAVALGRLPHLGPLSRMSEADETAIRSAMEQADVFALADRPVTELSGGES
jgi:iron complex transport system ATP-binding protein